MTPTGVEVPEFSLKVFAAQGAPSYWAYLARPDEVGRIIEEMKGELSSLDERAVIEAVESSPVADDLLWALPAMRGDTLLIGAQAYGEKDWATLDRRRSSLERDGALVFLTTPESFDALMRVAPNLASWLGGFVFAYEDPQARVEEERARRLETLRSWLGKTDDEVIREAKERCLPRDPEYAEWLSLLGHGNLLDV